MTEENRGMGDPETLRDDFGEVPPTDITSEDGEPTGTPTPEGDERVDWEDPSTEIPEEEDESLEAGVQVGLSPLGPMIVVVASDGSKASKVISVEECFLLAGQLTGLGGFIMQMSMQAQMQEQVRMQQMMDEGAQGAKKSPGGVYLK